MTFGRCLAGTISSTGSYGRSFRTGGIGGDCSCKCVLHFANSNKQQHGMSARCSQEFIENFCEQSLYFGWALSRAARCRLSVKRLSIVLTLTPNLRAVCAFAREAGTSVTPAFLRLLALSS